MGYDQKQRLQNILLLALGVILYGLFSFIPLLLLVFFSLVEWPGIGVMLFVGFENFGRVFFEAFYWDQFQNAFFNTLYYFTVVIVVLLTLGLALSLILSTNPFAGKTYRLIYFMPYAMATAAVAYLFDFFLSSRGPLNYLLKENGISLQGIPFFGHPDLALSSMSFIYIWHRMGFVVVILVAAIYAMRKNLIQSALVDGASKMRTIWHVILPYLTTALALIVMIVMVETFNNADFILVLMGPEAGPARSTDLLGSFLYRSAFGGAAMTGGSNYGMAATIGLLTAILLLPVIIFFGWLQFSRRRLD